MTLPKIIHPIFDVEIPSTKQIKKFRPYTVREEKLLLNYSKEDDISQAVDILKQIINNCSVDPLEIDKLAMFDIEYIFIRLRAKSVGETVNLFFNNEDIVEKPVPFIVPLDKVKIIFNKDHSNKIVFDDNDLTVELKYPTINSAIKLNEQIALQKDSIEVDELVFQLLIEGISKVYDKDKVYRDNTKDQLEQWISEWPTKVFDQVRRFYATMPTLSYDTEIKIRDKAGTEQTVKVELRGLKDFFII
jgi:hypothetical protein